MIGRPAAAEDVPALAGMAAASWQMAFVGILEAEALAARDAAYFGGRFGQVWERISVAVDSNGGMAGFLLVTAGHIDMLFVREPGRGVGSLLLRHAEMQGARSLECFRDNAAARRFYGHAGWQPVAAYDRSFLGKVRAFVRYEKD